ncbi:hypothetical protein RRG08_031267 [Elysia crispata]|uniref:Uncharacterized protein n=1 Tax=Elysia crispata TaxID=231223 RepID=A0AAE1DZD0_9GAST|nr:hypothetical protein RRG08_031267 [Elysia crispata]
MAARYEKRKEEHYLCARRRGEKEAGKDVSMALDTKWALKISIVKCLRYGDAKSGREMKAFGAEVFTFFYMVLEECQETCVSRQTRDRVIRWNFSLPSAMTQPEDEARTQELSPTELFAGSEHDKKRQLAGSADSYRVAEQKQLVCSIDSRQSAGDNGGQEFH